MILWMPWQCTVEADQLESFVSISLLTERESFGRYLLDLTVSFFVSFYNDSDNNFGFLLMSVKENIQFC
jgi:hypothetical protein